MKVKKKIILQIGKNLCSLALVLIMMICIIPQMTVKADNVGTTEEKLEEDWGAMSSAAGKMNMTNTTTKAQVMKVITAAAKNGTKAEWKSFRKVDATYESKGGVTAYLNLSLDGKTRELYINEVIPTLGNNRPEKGIAVSEDEWNILRLTNIERAKEGKNFLPCRQHCKKQPQSVPGKMSTIHSQHIPDQMEPATRLPFRLPLRIPDSARICTNVQKLLRHSLRCVDG